MKRMKILKIIVSSICAMALMLSMVTANTLLDAEELKPATLKMEVGIGELVGAKQVVLVTTTPEEDVKLRSIQLVVQRTNMDIVEIKEFDGPFELKGGVTTQLKLQLDVSELTKGEYVLTVIAKDETYNSIMGAYPITAYLGFTGRVITQTKPLISRATMTSKKIQVQFLSKDILAYLDMFLTFKAGNVVVLKAGTLITIAGDMTDRITQIRSGNVIAYVKTEDLLKVIAEYEYYPFYYKNNQAEKVNYVLSQLDKNLRDVTDDKELRRQVVLMAVSIVGKVPYFWGGKWPHVGWCPQWGLPRRVTSGNSPTTGTIRPFGTDCSGYTQWVFINALAAMGVENPKFPNGTANQWPNSSPLLNGLSVEKWIKRGMKDGVPPQVGDIGFRFSPRDKVNHVGIVVGWDEEGNILIAHNAGGTKITTCAEADLHYLRRPFAYDDYEFVEVPAEGEEYDDGSTSGDYGPGSGAYSSLPAGY